MANARSDEKVSPSPADATSGADASDELVGTTWEERYELLEVLGAGHISRVYRARHLQIDREVALKVVHEHLSRGDGQRERFDEEALRAAHLDHPNSIKVFDHGKSADGHLYVSMEFLKGSTLEEIIATDGPLSSGRACHIAAQIFKALAEAHQQGFTHRDLRSGNILVCDIYGETDFVKVLDYGFARAVKHEIEKQSLQDDGCLSAVPPYVAPELALGLDADQRSDLYSVGCLVYEMLTGAPPFGTGDDVDTVMRHVYESPVLLPGADGAGDEAARLAWLAGALLEKNPSRRPPRAERLVAYLSGYLDPEDVLASDDAVLADDRADAAPAEAPPEEAAAKSSKRTSLDDFFAPVALPDEEEKATIAAAAAAAATKLPPQAKSAAAAAAYTPPEKKVRWVALLATFVLLLGLVVGTLLAVLHWGFGAIELPGMGPEYASASTDGAEGASPAATDPAASPNAPAGAANPASASATDATAPVAAEVAVEEEPGPPDMGTAGRVAGTIFAGIRPPEPPPPPPPPTPEPVAAPAPAVAPAPAPAPKPAPKPVAKPAPTTPALVPVAVPKPAPKPKPKPKAKPKAGPKYTAPGKELMKPKVAPKPKPQPKDDAYDPF